MEVEQARLRFNALTIRKRPGIYPPVLRKYFPLTAMITLPMTLVCFSIAVIKNTLREKEFIRLLGSCLPWGKDTLGAQRRNLKQKPQRKAAHWLDLYTTQAHLPRMALSTEGWTFLHTPAIKKMLYRHVYRSI